MSNDSQLKHAELTTFRAVEQFKSAISMAELALKSSIVINGGAAVSVLTFVGNTKSIEKIFLIYGLLLFSLGVFLAATSTIFAYLAQNKYLEAIKSEELKSKDDFYRKMAIFVCSFSYFCFLAGIIFVALGMCDIGT
jgi:hypothetical protein